MITKEWLKQCRQLETELLILEEAKENAYNLALGSGLDISKDKVSASPRNSTEDKFAAYAEYSRLIDKKAAELANKRVKIRKLINRLENPLYRMVLQLYYLDCLSWEDVAFKMRYSIRQIHRFHGEALLVIRNLRDV